MDKPTYDALVRLLDYHASTVSTNISSLQRDYELVSEWIDEKDFHD